MPNLHIIPNGEQWNIKEENGAVVSTHDTQAAAEAARPYSARMNKVLANLAAPMQGRADAPPLLAGTGKDQTHLLVVCTAERRART